MIRDNASQFDLDFLHYSTEEIITAVKALNMNAIAERIVASVRCEAFNIFIICNARQLFKIFSEYIEFYNSKRPHQGIKRKIIIHE